MKRADWTHTGGLPLRQNLMNFIQDGILEAFGNVGRGPKVIVDYDNTQKAVYSSAYVLFGCVVTDNGDDTVSVSEGAIFQDGQVLTVPAHIITKSESASQVYYFEEEITNDPAGFAEYFDGDSHHTRKDVHAKLVFADFGDGFSAVADALVKRLTKVIVSVNNDLFNEHRFQQFMNIASPPVRTATLVNSWGTTHTGGITYWRDSNGIVTVFCSLIPASGDATNELVATLPIGYRPTTAVRAISRFNTGEGKNEFLKAHTNGQLKLETDEGTAIYGGEGITAMLQYYVPNV